MPAPSTIRTLALLGATGRTGRRVLEYALADGLAVRALARAPEALADLAHERLHVVQGAAEDAPAVARLVDGADAVLSAIGGGSTAEPGATRSTAARHVIDAMATRGTPEARFLAVAGGGILDAPAGGLRQDQSSFPAVFRAVSSEHRRVWETVRDSRLAWTMVCTGDIEPGERTGVYRTLPDAMPEGGRRISIEDLADYLLAELRDARFVRRRVGLAY
jgi:putative NADH-flavin reductase